MCGRFAIYELAEFRDYYLLDKPVKDVKPRYNAAPGQELPVILRDKKNQLNIMRWGLIPFWAKDTKIGYRLINARSESVFDKPTWRQSIAKRRCLVPTNGFYEWKKEEDGKQPYFITLKDRDLFSFAGLYDTWTNKETGEVIDSFSILTTTPNKEMKPIHDRMPVILPREAEEDWLDPSLQDASGIDEFLEPYKDGALDVFAVSKDVGNARNDYAELIQPLS